MIPKKYSGEELKNRYCRPVRKIKNGAGAAISPDTICHINAKDLKNITLDDLSDLGLGYRVSYIYGVCNNPALIVSNYDLLLTIPGIDKKVNSCIMLFGNHDLTQFPIDTWMKKLIKEIYDGNFDTTLYSGFEGFVQQLLFFYYRHLKGK